MATTPDVKVGQVWVDCDKRSMGKRALRVTGLSPSGERAHCRVGTIENGSFVAAGNRNVAIAVQRFRPTSNGYRLAEDVS